MRIRLAVTAAAIALAAGAAIAAEVATKPAAPAAPAAPALADAPYLPAGAIDTYKIIPPSPEQGSHRANADTAIFLDTRAMEGSERWKLAQADDDSAGILKSLSCAAGVELNPQTAPKLVKIVFRMRLDVSRATNGPKDIYKRPRPYLIAGKGNICIARTAALDASPDYPSGHNTWAWSVGLVTAEIDPERATEILARARAWGESRLICGVHSLAAVQAGRDNASSLVAALHGSAEFRADVDAARAEMVSLRANGPKPDPAACAREAALIAKAPYN